MNTAIVLAAALAINGTVWTHRVEENTTLEPWARDLERSLRVTPVWEWAPTTIIRLPEEAAHADVRRAPP